MNARSPYRAHLREAALMNTDRDPHGTNPHSPGAKLDAGKPMTSLLQDFGHALVEVSRVGTFGAKKYSRGGWQTVPDGFNRYSDAMLRHYFAERYDELDAESGLLHAAQTAWNALARLEIKLREARQPVRPHQPVEEPEDEHSP
jgi:hypothetical protein